MKNEKVKLIEETFLVGLPMCASNNYQYRFYISRLKTYSGIGKRQIVLNTFFSFKWNLFVYYFLFFMTAAVL